MAGQSCLSLRQADLAANCRFFSHPTTLQSFLWEHSFFVSTLGHSERSEESQLSAEGNSPALQVILGEGLGFFTPLRCVQNDTAGGSRNQYSIALHRPAGLSHYKYLPTVIPAEAGI